MKIGQKSLISIWLFFGGKIQNFENHPKKFHFNIYKFGDFFGRENSNILKVRFLFYFFFSEEETPEPQLQNIAGAAAVSSNSFASLSKLTGLAAGQEPTDTSIFEGKILGKSIITFFTMVSTYYAQ